MRPVRGFDFDFFFAPRFSLWDSFFLPEVDRARDTLRQLNDPFASIANHNSRVNQWRLFFPLLGNLLQLRDWQFLLLPFAGSLATLVYLARLCQRENFSPLETLLATTLCAMSPWYFVSTGWLAYFDSWFLLALLIACFSQRRWAIVAACLIAPWIDERFVLALPIVLLVRLSWSSKWDREPKQQRQDMIILVALTSVYPMVRLIALLLGYDPVAQVYASQHAATIQSVPLSTFLLGLWQGQRLLWLFAVVFIANGFRNWNRTYAWVSALLVIAMALGALVIAGDMHRSLEMLFPVCFAGLLICHDWFTKQLLPVLLVLTLLSAVLPASHRLWLENYPIARLPEEIKRARPAMEDLIRSGMARATQLQAEGDHAGALLIADEIVSLDDSLAEPLLFRSELHARNGAWEDAESDVNRARTLAPQSPDVAFAAGVLAVQRGDRAAAIVAFEEAMELGGPRWPGSGECARAIEILSRQ